jgi:hypothetical protein
MNRWSWWKSRENIDRRPDFCSNQGSREYETLMLVHRVFRCIVEYAVHFVLASSSLRHKHWNPYWSQRVWTAVNWLRGMSCCWLCLVLEALNLRPVVEDWGHNTALLDMGSGPLLPNKWQSYSSRIAGCLRKYSSTVANYCASWIRLTVNICQFSVFFCTFCSLFHVAMRPVRFLRRCRSVSNGESKFLPLWPCR